MACLIDTAEIERYFDKLWPICRSITGNGVRKTLEILSEIVPLAIHEVPTGTRVFDWVVPREWNIRDAHIVTPDGRKIARFTENNLHVVGYSVPVNKTVTFDELERHLHWNEDHPTAIPYKTSYYQETWGFCITCDEYKTLPREGRYTVLIDSSLEVGALTYGDLVLEGSRQDEILLSTYVCHPSMANNELSGPLVTAFLYRAIRDMPDRKYSYRFVFAPETIGAICYLARHGEALSERMKAGYIITCIGDNGQYTYKRSRIGTSLADEAAVAVLANKGVAESRILDFTPFGSDQRQYCSPGFNLPVGSIMRSADGSYPEYHTSLDNKEFICFCSMKESIETYYQVVSLLELNAFYRTTIQYCEPQLGRRGLYPSIGGKREKDKLLKAMLWILNQADGSVGFIEIVEASGIDFDTMSRALETLRREGLVELRAVD